MNHDDLQKTVHGVVLKVTMGAFLKYIQDLAEIR